MLVFTIFVGRSILHIGRRLIESARDVDTEVASFKRLSLAKVFNLLLPFHDMNVGRAVKGFSLHRSNSEGIGENFRCRTCVADKQGSVTNVKVVFRPRIVPVDSST